MKITFKKNGIESYTNSIGDVEIIKYKHDDIEIEHQKQNGKTVAWQAFAKDGWTTEATSRAAMELEIRLYKKYNKAGE